MSKVHWKLEGETGVLCGTRGRNSPLPDRYSYDVADVTCHRCVRVFLARMDRLLAKGRLT